MDELNQRLAVNVRRLRDLHSLSLSQLSARSGVAKSTLSQIEAGSTNPTLGTLASLAEALFVDARDLVSSDVLTPGVIHVASGEGHDVSSDMIVGRLAQSAMVGPSVLEFHNLTLTPGTHDVSPSHGTGSREHVLIMSGKVLLGPVDEMITAQRGDYVSYPTDRLHKWEVVGDTPAVVWVVASFPRTMQ